VSAELSLTEARGLVDTAKADDAAREAAESLVRRFEGCVETVKRAEAA
jgi:hypothetical protein